MVLFRLCGEGCQTLGPPVWTAKDPDPWQVDVTENLQNRCTESIEIHKRELSRKRASTVFFTSWPRWCTFQVSGTGKYPEIKSPGFGLRNLKPLPSRTSLIQRRAQASGAEGLGFRPGEAGKRLSKFVRLMYGPWHAVPRLSQCPAARLSCRPSN